MVLTSFAAGLAGIDLAGTAADKLITAPGANSHWEIKPKFENNPADIRIENVRIVPRSALLSRATRIE